MPTPVTAGLALGTCKPFAMTTLGVTVAIEGLLLANVIVRLPVAGLLRLTGKASVWPGATVGIAPMLIRLDVTTMSVVAVGKPVAAAVIVAVPAATPCAVNGACMAPSGMNNTDGATVAVAALLLDSATETPPVGAGSPRVTAPLTVRPTPTRGLCRLSDKLG